jgi:Flp pilus assembly protein TadG
MMAQGAIKMTQPSKSLLARFRRDRSGVSAIEFALILPAMVAMFFGIGEVSSYMQAASRMTKVASTVADLVAQDTAVNDAELEDIFNCANAIMAPFDPSNGWVRVTSVRANALGVTTVAWSEGRGISGHAPGPSVTVPGGIVPPNSSVIMAEVNYTYTSTYGMFLTSGVTSSDEFYARPRRSVEVTYTP